MWKLVNYTTLSQGDFSAIKLIVICSVCMICLAPTIFAEKTVKTIEGQLGFISQTEAGKIYENEVTINPPDGITKMIDAQIVVKGDFQEGTSISAKIGEHFCSPSIWQVPNIDVTNYEAIFDCSELAKNFKGGNMILSFATNKIAQNVKGSYKITYYNNPKIEINLLGTEYDISDETGKIFLQLLDDQKNIIDNASCFISMYYPNQTKKHSIMTYAGDGLYFLDIEIPKITGIYMLSALCLTPKNTEVISEDDFECGEYDCGTNWNDDWQYNDATSCRVTNNGNPIDNYHLKANNPAGGCPNCYAYRSFNNLNCNDSGYLTFYAKARNLENNDHCYYEYYNGSSYHTLLDISENEDDDIYRFYSFEVCNTYGKSADARIRIHTHVTDDSDDKCYLDNVRFYYAKPFNESSHISIRGSGELHVTNRFENLSTIIENASQNELIEKIWNYSNRSASADLYELVVSGTEYNSGEEGTIFAQFLKTVGGTGQPVNDAICNLTVYYPNSSVFFTSYMNYINGSNGLYSYNFIVPQSEGTYSADIFCSKGGVKAYSSNTFHIGQWSNQIGYILTNQTTIYNYLIAHNQSIYQKTILLENLMEEVNSSIWNKLYKIQEELANITSIIELISDDISSTNSTLHTYLNNINESLYSKLLYIEELINNIDVNTTDLENLILSINSTLHSHLDANNLTIMTKLYTIQAELQTILNNQDDIFTNQTTIYNFLSQVNQSLADKLLMIENDIGDINNLLSYVNNSVWNIKTDIQTILANQNNILANQTTIYQKLEILENGIEDIIFNQSTLYDFMVAYNTSIWNKLFGIQNELTNILNNQSIIYDYLMTHNQTILQQLYKLENDICDILANQTTIYDYLIAHNQTISELINNIDVNTTKLESLINSMNESIFNKLYNIQEELAEILENQTILQQMLYSHNQTIYDKLTEINNDLSAINNNIDLTNQTIMNKLYSIQSELANITNLTETAISLIYDTNQSIMGYLYDINYSLWYSIYDVWNNIANMTNISMEITADLTDLPKETYLYFQTVEERLVHNNDFCINNTHRKELLIEKCVAGDCYNITKNIDEVCPYGCSQGTCNPFPQVKYGIFIIAILLMLGFMYMMYQIARRT